MSTWAFQSSADFSKVVSFFPPLWDPAGEGSSASCNFGLRRMGGRLVVKGCACAPRGTADVAVVAVGAASSVDGVGVPEPEPEPCVSFWPFGGFQRGHFFASAESSGTSTISLSSRSQRLNRRKEKKEKKETGTGTHTTSSPANRCRFTILIIRLSGSFCGCVDGVLTDSWNLSHNACRSLQPLTSFSHMKDVPHLFATAKSSWVGERPSTRGRLGSRSSDPEVSESGCYVLRKLYGNKSVIGHTLSFAFRDVV